MGHKSVNSKADEYVRGSVHTNTVESYYSIFKVITHPLFRRGNQDENRD